jgi:DNA-3-methyladenine glycosylase II
LEVRNYSGMKQMTFSDTFVIQPLEPFNFDLTAHLFCNGDKQVRTYMNGKFQQVLRINGNLVLANLTSMGSIEQPVLSVKLISNNLLTSLDNQKAQETISYIFNLYFGLSAFYKEVETDHIMHRIVQHLYGLKLPTYPTVFESLVNSIVEQQISIKVARLIEDRLTKKFGEQLVINGETYYAFPTPHSLAGSSIEEVRKCGLSQRKAEYIQQAALLIEEGKLDLEHLKNRKSPELILSELDEIRGIGVWTAELIMLEGMQMMEVLPADDFGIKRVISRYYYKGMPIKNSQARDTAQAWGKWKGLAAYYLIVAETKGITLRQN